jgi:hypothetical protein
VTAFGNLGNSLEALRLLGNRLTSLQAGYTHNNPAFELSNSIRAAVGLDILNALIHTYVNANSATVLVQSEHPQLSGISETMLKTLHKNISKWIHKSKNIIQI